MRRGGACRIIPHLCEDGPVTYAPTPGTLGPGRTGVTDSVDGTITDAGHEAMLRATLSRVRREELKAALARTADPRLGVPTAVGNAVNALRRHPDPAAALGKVQYRAVLPYAAATLSDGCLAATIEALGDHADDPTRDQLLGALDAVREDYDDPTIAVMLASVADGEMPASDLCFEVLATDARFGVTAAPSGRCPPDRPPRQSMHVHHYRWRQRLRVPSSAKSGDAGNSVMQSNGGGPPRRPGRPRNGFARPDARRGSVPTARSPRRSTEGRPPARVVATHVRRATLTPAQEEEFDREDPWVGGVVYAWVPFDAVDPENPELDGKTRPCVVVAGSATHVLVRPGYSDRGVKSRDWKSVPVGHWRRAGFAESTWIDVEMVRVERPAEAPLGWLETEDWNALW